MANKISDNIRLGIFVFSGFALLVVALFYIGRSNSIFSNDPILKVKFTNIGGLKQGSNVLFSGINAGTVKNILLIDDQNIEVTLLIDKAIFLHIPKNSVVSIGTEGLMGNKVVNITPLSVGQVKVQDGDYLLTDKKPNMDKMLETLSHTNDNIAEISEALKTVSLRIKDSEVIDLLDDKELSQSLRESVRNVKRSSANAEEMFVTLNEIVRDTKSGKGAVGVLLTDQKIADDLRQTIENMNVASQNAKNITLQLNDLVVVLNHDVSSGKGPVHALLQDSTLTQKINNSLENIEKGTENFNQNMEALKHNFLFRGYFKKQEKQRKKEK